MKKRLQLPLVSILVLSSAHLFSQSAGTLTFTFTQIAHSPCYSASKNVMAVWIENSSGTFVKTRLRDCCNGSTFDHLPVWSVNAGGVSNNCSSANTVTAITGATLTSFGTKTITWDGKNVAGASNGTVVPDGIYKIAIESTWNHGNTSTVTNYYTFTKGTTADHQTPASDANFSNITLDWVPSSASVEDISEYPQLNVFPNPGDGIFNVDLFQVNNITVFNALGSVIYTEKVEHSAVSTKIDLSDFPVGIYFLAVSNDKSTANKKIILSR